MTHEALVSKVWNYATVPMGVGVQYSAYTEQIPCLLILKVGAERSALLVERSTIPEPWRREQPATNSGEGLGLRTAAALP